MATLDEVARTVLRERYLRQDEAGTVIETPDELFRRVADAVAAAEDDDVEGTADRFYDALSALEFLPNSPTLMNAGTDLHQLAACFVLPIEDSLVSIFETLKRTALIHQSGGGTGFSFSKIRPVGDVVAKTGGVASGPVSFMRIFDVATEQIKQGGRRRGANMGVLDASHPDVRAFVTAKHEADAFRNFNLSVATDAAFWDAVESGEPYDLVNPRTGETVDRVDADAILDLIAELAWATGDPGLLFLDEINTHNPTPALGRIEATNPCGEVPLLPYEACILGSVNLGEMTDGDKIDREKLARTVRLGVRFLDDALDVSTFPVADIERAVSRTRKVGVGVMGFHDMLVDIGVAYDSDEAVAVADEVMQLVSETAWETSRRLAEERGPFPVWSESVFDDPVRNATTTTIAPTGTISMIAGATAGIEPIYNVVYEKQVLGGLEMVNDRFVEIAKARGFYDEDLLTDLKDRTSIQDVDAIPADVKRLFQTAHDVPPERHVAVQAAFQHHVDNAVSKTVNLPSDASVDDVRTVFLAARDQGLKGITVFRSGARPEQVLGDDPLKEECVGECEYAGRE
ncbi:adenosylcobalamin-dependent ribonucleoside-diphosphate reductase [Haloplanus aerogenes]|uniref:Vitamin B12-dependent ribonucleotide reductase n=1 Tax=Haloplanus aerogenes TaxID=660522 RepID=A0A3G8QNB8_9EURY|nr:adenosylcobalamin-dependent ribonucleoside-diphosphate reductase [Haloplanus aerogenes]AZH23936.1 adenosylcobalamin-dependent ribonucleoside-diphosphate reductase [Haloplanus aerogenes]RMB13301.1 ribonucleoside-diphosphate reductase class II [Haloplanus aerogenes]